MNKIFKNSLFSIVRTFVVVPLNILIVPYTLYKVGQDGYGVWALIGVLSNFKVFVEFGFSSSLIMFVAREEASRREFAINYYFNSAFFIFLFLAIILIILSLNYTEFILSSLNISKEFVDAKFLIVAAIFATSINFLTGLFKSIMDGYQRMEISNSLLTLNLVINSLGTFIFLYLGFGLRGLGLNMIIISIITFFLNFYFAKRIYPELKLGFSFIDKIRLHELFSYSIKLQLSNLLRFWIEPLNKIIISHIFSLNYVAYYDLALKFVNQIRSLILSGLTPLFPAATEINEKHGIEKIKKLKNISLKYIIPLSFLLYSLLIVLVPNLLVLWLKLSNTELITVIRIFLIGHFILLIVAPQYIILNSLGYPHKTLNIQVISSFFNVFGIIIFAYLFGFVGFSLGYLFSLIIGFFLTINTFNKIFKDRGIGNLRNYRMKFIFIFIFISSLGIAFSLFNFSNTIFYIILYSIIHICIGLYLFVGLQIYSKDDLVLLLGKSTTEKIIKKFGIK